MRRMTDKGIASLRPRHSRYAVSDAQMPGLWIRVQPSGAKSYAAVTRDPSGRQVWAGIGPVELMGIDAARDKAREAINRIRAGLPAFEAPPDHPDSFQAVAENWLKRHAQAKRLRSQKQIERLLRVHVFPLWGKRPFLSLRRSDVAALLDGIEDSTSARQADCVLTVIRSVMNWFATRHDDYTPPIVRGMRRQNPKEHQRDRVLDDAEIRSIWKQAEANGSFGTFVRLALLTAQRRAKLATMKWADVVDGEWIIAKESPREKDSAGSLPLPKIALEIINAQPKLASNPFVFAGRADRAFNGYSKMKRRFDAALPAESVASWTIHDLRRTSRSLLSRAGVSPEHAERIMGHAVVGVAGVYDRHSYHDEKAAALNRLAQLISNIVDERRNVVPMAKRAIGRAKKTSRNSRVVMHVNSYK
jgi:integrase